MDKIKIYTLIKLYDKTIHFSRSNKTINKYSGSEDEFMLDIEVAVAKKMSNDISRKTKMGMQEKAEQGLYPSNAPLGYRNNPITHLIDVDDRIAPYIKRAFSLMSCGSYSLSMLCDILHREGFKGKKGNRVNKSAIDHILRNPIYCGAFRWKKQHWQGSHAPLITKELFDKVQNVLQGNHRPHIHRTAFAFNNLLTCGVCDCTVLGEQKKEKYTYYHCSFSKGRHNSVGYYREEELAKMFEEPVKDITLPNDIADWLRKGLKERHRDTLQLQENRLDSLKNQYERVNNRLSSLFDLRLDKEIDEEAFKAKENEFKTQLIEIKAQMKSAEALNPNFYKDGCKTLELSNRLHSVYVNGNCEQKAKILKLIASNYTLLDTSICPTYRKPFDLLAKGLSRTEWLTREDSNLGPGG